MRRWNGWEIRRFIIRRPKGQLSFLKMGEKPISCIMKDGLH
jgi:hypothetical protein